MIALSACARTEAGCAGWRPVFIAPATAAYLDATDQPALRGLLAHQTYGQLLGCWE
ncbi:hypothetical protein BVG79_01700 [Ketogulonicigenium robustum]|uniref:Uncharacterized protein n=1 Tax=Ketogulonicigenium robustum TaxID=92947 RepID=A0A1W6P0S8_9RHOB|nr:hypothetical protein [Ketogulonicigenium robustum]ARO15044.1 hypothetical protein BVG79_01700 [Ketogulonicigenium robustum]